MKFSEFLYKRKFEILLFALLQHLFIGVFMTNSNVYLEIVWPINMLVLGLGLIGVFSGKESWKKWVRNILFVTVVALPLCLHFSGNTTQFMEWTSILYVLFFGFIFYELIRFMIRPGYINVDIISAAICGYLLLIEISTFLFQAFFYHDQSVFKGVDTTSTPSIYMDMVYFSSISVSSIGFGDITPSAHSTKLITALLGIVAQFYSVVLVGILISKFTSRSVSNSKKND